MWKTKRFTLNASAEGEEQPGAASQMQLIISKCDCIAILTCALTQCQEGMILHLRIERGCTFFPVFDMNSNSALRDYQTVEEICIRHPGIKIAEPWALPRCVCRVFKYTIYAQDVRTHNAVVIRDLAGWGDYSNCRDRLWRQLAADFRHDADLLEKQKSIITSFFFFFLQLNAHKHKHSVM